MASFWQYSATQRFFYGNKEQGGGFASLESTLSDWNREIRAGKGTQILINGRPIGDLRQGKEFESQDELCTFFATELFSKAIPEEKEILAKHALSHFHQGGLPFASHHCLVNAQLKKNTQIKFPNEVSMVNIVPIKGGVSIIADHTYPTVVVGNKKNTTSTYHAKIHCEMSFTTKGIHVQDLTIDCPNSAAAKILDPRTVRELLQHIINKISQAIWPNQDLPQPAELNVDDLDEAKAVMRFAPRGANS
ncbi:TPA: hypothetical protein ACPSKE_001528 [Legionella feeleii]